MFMLTTGGGGLTLSGYFDSLHRRPVWNVLKEDEDKQDLEDFGLDQDIEVLGGLTAQVDCHRFQIVFPYLYERTKTIRKRHHLDVFQGNQIRGDRA